jgi:hypothetical protein
MRVSKAAVERHFSCSVDLDSFYRFPKAFSFCLFSVVLFISSDIRGLFSLDTTQDVAVFLASL